jgi:tetratricopeptide (TPR) repeat protein
MERSQMRLTLRLTYKVEGARISVNLDLFGLNEPQVASANFDFNISAQDREDVRWYLEEFLQYTADPAPAIAARIEQKLITIGNSLFVGTFAANEQTERLWKAVAPHLPETRVEIASEAGVEFDVPWELLRNPAVGTALILLVDSFVYIIADQEGPDRKGVVAPIANRSEPLRVLLVIARPGGLSDVPFRSVARQLVLLSSEEHQALQLDVLRPPSFGRLKEVLTSAEKAGEPYQIVHFDGHGIYLDEEAVGARGDESRRGVADVLLASGQPGPCGFLVFEGPAGRRELVDGKSLGSVLSVASVPVLVLNACRSAHAELTTKPDVISPESTDASAAQVYHSLAHDVFSSGVGGVVAMRYNVYVETAARFIGEIYVRLLAGDQLGTAVSSGRRDLAANPLRHLAADPVPLSDWMVPVVYEAAPLALRPWTSSAEQAVTRFGEVSPRHRDAVVGQPLTGGSVVGFCGQDGAVLALDRAFDDHQAVVLHAWAGAGKTATALEFARWYTLTSAADLALFTSFNDYVSLAKLLEQIGKLLNLIESDDDDRWGLLSEDDRRDRIQLELAKRPILWIWDNVEEITGFPPGSRSAWTESEQEQIRHFLRQLVRHTRCKVLLTSRRNESAWLHKLPVRLRLPEMPMSECLQLVQAIAAIHSAADRRLLSAEEIMPLLIFCQGNPLATTILVKQVLHDQPASATQITQLVDKIRSGAEPISDDDRRSRDSSLTVSLNYGYVGVFTELEKNRLSTLSLFERYVDARTVCMMGDPALHGGPIDALVNISPGEAITLLRRAADAGLLTDLGDGTHYDLHPAAPWYLRDRLAQYCESEASGGKKHVLHAWTVAMHSIGHSYAELYRAGDRWIIDNIDADETNLLNALRIARGNDWNQLAQGPINSLEVLYTHTGRKPQWRHLVDDIASEYIDSTDSRSEDERLSEEIDVLGWKVRNALDRRDWAAAAELQKAVIAERRRLAAGALAQDPAALTRGQQVHISKLAEAISDLGEVLRGQDKPDCVRAYREALDLCLLIDDRSGAAAVAFNLGHAYKSVRYLRNLDLAQEWYQRALDLTTDGDRLVQGLVFGQMAALDHERFLEAKEAEQGPEHLNRYLQASASRLIQASKAFPDDAVDELANAYNSLGIVFTEAGDIGQALLHFQKAVKYRQASEDYFGSGRTRHNVALVLMNNGRAEDALLYARAALDDFWKVGPGGVENAQETRQLIGLLYAQLGNIESAQAQFDEIIREQDTLRDPLSSGRSRYNAAYAMLHSARSRDALSYAQAALQDFRSAGPIASGEVQRTQRLIAEISEVQ